MKVTRFTPIMLEINATIADIFDKEGVLYPLIEGIKEFDIAETTKVILILTFGIVFIFLPLPYLLLEIDFWNVSHSFPESIFIKILMFIFYCAFMISFFSRFPDLSITAVLLLTTFMFYFDLSKPESQYSATNYYRKLNYSYYQFINSDPYLRERECHKPLNNHKGLVQLIKKIDESGYPKTEQEQLVMIYRKTLESWKPTKGKDLVSVKQIAETLTGNRNDYFRLFLFICSCYNIHVDLYLGQPVIWLESMDDKEKMEQALKNIWPEFPMNDEKLIVEGERYGFFLSYYEFPL